MFYRLNMQAVRLGCGMAVALVFSACTTIETKPPQQQSLRLGLKLPPSALGATISLQQHFSVERGDRIDELDAALEVDGQHLEMVGLAFGQRVLTMHYDGKELKTWRHQQLPPQVRADEVLEDMQLTLWPIAAIRPALPAGWRIEEVGLRRTLLADDVVVMTIDYSGQPRWNGKITVSNLRYHYRLVIQSVSTTQ